jgi:hypothetical protein
MSRLGIGVRTGPLAGAQGHWAAVVDMHSSSGGHALKQSVDAFSDGLPGGVQLSLKRPSGGRVVLRSDEVLGDVLVPAATSRAGLQHPDEVRREAIEHWLPDVFGVGGKHDVGHGDVYPGLGEGSHQSTRRGDGRLPLFGLPGLPDGPRVHKSLHEQIPEGVQLDVGGDQPGMAPGSRKSGLASASRPCQQQHDCVHDNQHPGSCPMGTSSGAARRRSGAAHDDR